MIRQNFYGTNITLLFIFLASQTAFPPRKGAKLIVPRRFMAAERDPRPASANSDYDLFPFLTLPGNKNLLATLLQTYSNHND